MQRDKSSYNRFRSDVMMDATWSHRATTIEDHTGQANSPRVLRCKPRVTMEEIPPGAKAVTGTPMTSSSSSRFTAGRQQIPRDSEFRCSDEERWNAVLSGAKAISSLMKMELEGFCGLEQESVYGAAVALPQIARSASWPKSFTGLSIRVYILLALNFFLQGFLICVINEEALIMNPFGGQMHLCDFGGNLESCPGGRGCTGPGGTEITPARLYTFRHWSTRTYFRDSLVSVFPEHKKQIESEVDPGEYGTENWTCRLVCLFLFMMGVVDDLSACVELAVLVVFVPSEEGYWISYETPDWADKDIAKTVKDLSELDLIKFQVAGMPIHWKVTNVICVLVPKFLLWYSVTAAGFRFLMETPDIIPLIVNSMALTFILDIDELIIDRFATVATKHIMQSLEDFPLFDAQEEEEETPEQAYKRLAKTELAGWRLGDYRVFLLCIPKKLQITIALMIIFTCKYYFTYCYKEEDGTWVSKDLHLPKGVHWDPLSLFFTARNEDDDPAWSMAGALAAAAAGRPYP